jgi:hypothetical protein
MVCGPNGLQNSAAISLLAIATQTAGSTRSIGAIVSDDKLPMVVRPDS